MNTRAQNVRCVGSASMALYPRYTWAGSLVSALLSCLCAFRSSLLLSAERCAGAGVGFRGLPPGAVESTPSDHASVCTHAAAAVQARQPLRACQLVYRAAKIVRFTCCSCAVPPTVRCPVLAVLLVVWILASRLRVSAGCHRCSVTVSAHVLLHVMLHALYTCEAHLWIGFDLGISGAQPATKQIRSGFQPW
eukprot:TRINITY_DN3576_c0_g1_i2.p1 TRINITY_DN3576_c0_g1~~TRINITY_DN3576_c0_g1_i2.p1  ORF type:complete len:192 (-),score=14.06 TRINITY_DN3576_c0_g1_i2:105-680(-)